MFIKPEELCIKNFYEALQRITVEVWQRLMHPGIKKMQSFESIILQKRPVAEWKINELTLVSLHYVGIDAKNLAREMSMFSHILKSKVTTNMDVVQNVKAIPAE